MTSDQGTFGRLTIPPFEQEWQSLELPWRDNIRNASCIPDGVYPIRPHRSPRFGNCLLLDSVPNRSAILIHPGNFAGLGDNLSTHSRGCILVGKRSGILQNGYHFSQAAILASRIAQAEIIEAISKLVDDLYIDINGFEWKDN